MFISDTLSRAALPLRHAKPDSPEYLIFQVSQEESFRKEIEETNLEEAPGADSSRNQQGHLTSNLDVADDEEMA